MADLNDPQEDDDRESPQNIADIKLRLLHNEPDDPDTRLAIEEMTRMGPDAAPLIPLVVEMLVNERLRFLSVEALIELYRNTRSAELLQAWRARMGDRPCNPYDTCRLLELGVAEVEYGLLEYLWRHWESERSADSDLFARFYCNEIVKAIGKHGSAKSLEMMEVIQYKLAASVQELRASLPDDWDEDIRVLSAPELIGMGIFLKNVREAVSSLRHGWRTGLSVTAGF